jgi:hypothetical protein
LAAAAVARKRASCSTASRYRSGSAARETSRTISDGGVIATIAVRSLAQCPELEVRTHFAATGFANFGFERTLELYDSSVVLVEKFP